MSIFLKYSVHTLLDGRFNKTIVSSQLKQYIYMEDKKNDNFQFTFVKEKDK